MEVHSVHYFNTSIPGSGIFLPVHRAEKRASPAVSLDSFPATPNTPSHSNYSRPNFTPAANRPNFSQSVGPGTRAPSPQLKKPRQSLPRPESPFRKQPPSLQPTPARQASSTKRGPIAQPRFTNSPAPGRVSSTPKASFSASTSRAPPPRPFSRNNSRLGHRDAIAEDAEERPVLRSNHSFSQSTRSPSRLGSSSNDAEVQRLKIQLEEKDKQLKEQAAALADMEASLQKVQSIIDSEQAPNRDDDMDVARLRQELKEKNDKIQEQIADFDAHRADFRSTIDALELAASETERVYESKVADLEAELAELRELRQTQEDVESVAEQLKSLEDLVSELEEGLEDARRGEAEARGEVEFLRGEVERGRSELRREREKAAKALQGAKEAEGMNSPRNKDVEMKDDEIRGLKAIIHSLSSSTPDVASPAVKNRGEYVTDKDEVKRMQDAMQQLEHENSELQGLVERKTFREEQLERQLENVRGQTNGQRERVDSNGLSEHSASHGRRSPQKTHHGRVEEEEEEAHEDEQTEDPRPGTASAEADGGLWCEACETKGHDILSCTNMFGANGEPNKAMKESLREGFRKLKISHERSESATPAPLAPSRSKSSNSPEGLKEKSEDGAKGAEEQGPGASADAGDKWCALCEQDGHLAFDCPNEQY